MNADQLARVSFLSKRRKQLDAFALDVSPVLIKSLAKAEGALAAYNEECSEINLPLRLGRDLEAAVESLKKCEQWIRKESSACTSQLADLAAEWSSTPVEVGAP